MNQDSKPQLQNKRKHEEPANNPAEAEAPLKKMKFSNTATQKQRKPGGKFKGCPEPASEQPRLRLSPEVEVGTEPCISQHNAHALRKIKAQVSSGIPHEKYLRLEEIGRGGVCKVYKGMKIRGQEKVAIKVFSLDYDLDDEPYIPRFDKELAITKYINQPGHSNIIRYLDSYLLEDEIWMVMEYVDGIELLDLQSYVLTDHEIAVIYYNILKGLESLHNNQAIHRDLKTNNILLAKNGDVKIIDFGYSTIIGTQMRKAIGTSLFMPPEQISTTTYNTKVDIWAMGMTLVDIINCSLPYEDENDRDKVQDLIVANGKPIIPNLEDWDPDLVDFLDQCLTVNPAERPTATQLLSHKFFLKHNVNSKEIVAKLVQDVSKAK